MSAHPTQSKLQSLKILFITENFPFPLDSGGRIRTFHILKGLARHHEVTLITTLSNEEQTQNIVVFQNICKNVSIVRVKKKSNLEKVKRVFKNFFSPIPIVVEMHYSPEVVSEIKLQMDREVFNVVHFDHLDASYYLPIIEQRAIFGQKIITVLDEHNIVSNQVKTSIDAEPNFIKKIYMRTQLEKTFQYEKKVCSLVTRNLVCSEYDKKSLLAMTNESASVVTIPNGVDVSFFSDKSSFDNRKFAQVENSIIFVGMLDYGPGAVAIRFFCKEVLPILIQEIPDIKFYVIGSKPPPISAVFNKRELQYLS